MLPDPGPCGICGAAHTACTAPNAAALVVPQLPARDALARQGAPATAPAAPLGAELLQAGLPPGEFTTGAYRGDKGRRR